MRFEGSSDYVATPDLMLARNAGALGALADDPRWETLISDGGRIWTDDFANLLSVLQ